MTHLRAQCALLAAMLVVWPARFDRARAQTPWVLDWLRDYAGGDRRGVIARLKTIADIGTFERDLDQLAPGWIATKGASPDAQRRILAGLAMEAAAAKLTNGPAATRLVEWACRQIRRQTAPGEFERRWHLAAFALLAGGVVPDALEAHVTHMKFHFPKEDRLLLERGIASELRTAPFVATKMSASDRTKQQEEAARRFREAAAVPATRVEALVRLAHVEVSLGHGEAAIEALTLAEPDLRDPDFIYLARLFRGQAAERLGQVDAARAFYQAALSLRPGMPSATTALAALEFRAGAREQADTLVSRLLQQTLRPADPWWTYWPGDYRRADALLAAMREALP